MPSGKANMVITGGNKRVLSFLNSPWPVLILLGLFCWMAVTAQLDKSPAFDELPHLTGGYTYWTANDYRLHSENGVLPQRWIAVPLLFGRYNLPLNTMPSWNKGQVWNVGYHFFYDFNNNLSAMLLGGRAMITTMAVGLGVLVYAWARTLFGPAGGLLSLWLFIFCPTVLAHGSLMTSDLPASLFLTASVWVFWTMLQHISARTVILGAVAIAGTLLSKASGLALLPIGFLLLVIRLFTGRPLRVSLFGRSDVYGPVHQLAWLGLAIAIQVLVVTTIFWSFYGFRYAALASGQEPPGEFAESWEEVLTATKRWTPLIQFGRAHHLLPEAYLYGFAFRLSKIESRSAFLNGNYSETGWWYFFPYSLLVKTPFPFFVVAAMAAAGIATRRRYGDAGKSALATKADLWYATIPVWVLLGVYWAFALTSHLNIGHRHILPTYPAMFVLTGAAACWFRRPSAILKGIVLASLVWFAAESLSIRPHYLAYFNRLAGGPTQAYRHLVDSSLDWGQDLPALKRWLEQHVTADDDRSRILLGYFGMGSPAYYGINARLFPDSSMDYRSSSLEALKPLTGGVYCVSASILQGVYLKFPGPWTDSYERMYGMLLSDVRRYQTLQQDPEQKQRWVDENGGSEVWDKRLEFFDALRAARLLAYLRKREPDDHVGYSILIYRLTDGQVGQALFGPPPYS